MKSSETTEDTPVKKAGKIKRFFLWTAKSLLILIVLLFLASVVQNIIATKKLRQIEEQIISEGLPITWNDVEKMYSDIDPDKNGHKAFISALMNIKNLPEYDEETMENDPIVGQASLPSLGEPLPAEMIQAMTNVVAMSSDALDDLKMAVSMKPLFFLKPTNDFMFVNSEYIAQLRHGSRLFSERAIVKSELGENDGAVEAVIDGINLATVLEPDPYMIMTLIRIACTGIAYNGLEIVLSAEGINNDHLNALEDALSHQPESAKPCIIGETVPLRHIYESLQNSQHDRRRLVEFLPSENDAAFMLLSLSKGWFRMNEAYCIEQFHEYSSIWDKPWYEFLEENDKIMTTIPRLYNINAWWGSTLSLLKQRELRLMGMWDLSRMGVAVKRYILANQKPPKTLKDLVPEYMASIPTDPFAGEEYNYEHGDDSVTLSFEGYDYHKPFTFTILCEKSHSNL